LEGGNIEGFLLNVLNCQNLGGLTSEGAVYRIGTDAKMPNPSIDCIITDVHQLTRFAF
jgi:hypothetical protein